MAMATATITDGIYFLHPSGSAWIAAHFRDGRLLRTTEDSNAATHAAANDSWSGVVPQDTDQELQGDEAERIIREVMGDDVDCELVVVTRAS